MAPRLWRGIPTVETQPTQQFSIRDWGVLTTASSGNNKDARQEGRTGTLPLWQRNIPEWLL